MPSPEPSEVPRSYICYRTPSPPQFDGNLASGPWANATWTEDFVDIEGLDRNRPRFRTRAKLLWDDEALYVGAELEEPHVWATLTDHDSIIFQDNDFEIFIDPDGDGRLYAELELNAFNTTWDLLLVNSYRGGGPAINGWEIAGLKTAVSVHGTLNDPSDEDQGWTIFCSIPFASLREISNCSIPPNSGDQWRLNFSRVEWETEIHGDHYVKVPGKSEDNWVWSPQGVIDMHRPERWGVVQFESSPNHDAVPKDLRGFSQRLLLAELWEQQISYKRSNGSFAKDLAQLGIKGSQFKLQATDDMFQASLDGESVDHTLTFRSTAKGRS